ncbi:hypothetical protein B0H19DRAFT_1111700 [Mycena capillaripes]|nr:hypothetical protein B0H19DRAFT_1111700 [Mycena capillaripes]
MLSNQQCWDPYPTGHILLCCWGHQRAREPAADDSSDHSRLGTRSSAGTPCGQSTSSSSP